MDKNEIIAEAQAEQQKIDLAVGELAQEIIRTWKSDPNLRAEFGDSVLAYAGYVKAMASGNAKIFSGGGLTKCRASSILRVDAVCARTGLSRSSVDRLEDRGEFPARLQLSGSGAVGWLDSDVDAWIAARPRGI